MFRNNHSSKTTDKKYLIRKSLTSNLELTMAECLQMSQNSRNDSNSDTDDDDYEEFCENFTFSVSTCHIFNILKR